MNKPQLTVARDAAGKVESVYVRLREGKAAYSNQPNPDALVFFEIDRNRTLMGITFLAPLWPSVAFSTVVQVLSSVKTESPAHDDVLPTCPFAVSDDEFLPAMRGTCEAVAEFKDNSGGACT